MQAWRYDARRATSPHAVQMGSVLARHEPKVRHQFARGPEAAPIRELGREDHCAVCVEPAEALQSRDLRGEPRRPRERGDLPIQFIAPTEFVLQERELLAEHEPIFRRQHGVGACQAAQPLVVWLAPRRGLEIHQPPAREEFQNVVP